MKSQLTKRTNTFFIAPRAITQLTKQYLQTVFGSLSILAGVCSLLYPETSKTEFLTSMDEAEKYYRNHAKIFRFCERK